MLIAANEQTATAVQSDHVSNVVLRSGDLPHKSSLDMQTPPSVLRTADPGGSVCPKLPNHF